MMKRGLSLASWLLIVTMSELLASKVCHEMKGSLL